MTVVSVTLTIAYSRAHCANCGRLVCSLPGLWTIEVRTVDDDATTGRGVVLACQRCRTLLEVIAHG